MRRGVLVLLFLEKLHRFEDMLSLEHPAIDCCEPADIVDFDRAELFIAAGDRCNAECRTVVVPKSELLAL
jgi:hypothetical protein